MDLRKNADALLASWNEKNIKYWIQYIEALKTKKVAGRTIDLGQMKVKLGNKETQGADAVITAATMSEKKTRSSAGRFSSKLQKKFQAIHAYCLNC